MRFWKANRRLLNRMSYMSDGTISLSIYLPRFRS
jgi:hypothetical protein